MSEDNVHAKGGPYDLNDPRSLINIMPKEARVTFNDIPPDILKMECAVLEKEIQPSTRLNQIRLAFWKEYESAQATVTSMTFKGIMAYLGNVPSLFLLRALRNPAHLAWILNPPASYENTLEEAMMRGLGRVNEILTLPFYTQDGLVDHKTVELVLKATAFIDVRIHGKPTEHISQVNRNLDVRLTSKDVQQLGGTRVQDLDDKIRRLEEALKPEQFDKQVLIDG